MANDCTRLINHSLPENTLSHMKHFKVLAHRFRHSVELYHDAFGAVVGIVNDRIDRRLSLAAAA